MEMFKVVKMVPVVVAPAGSCGAHMIISDDVDGDSMLHAIRYKAMLDGVDKPTIFVGYYGKKKKKGKGKPYGG